MSDTASNDDEVVARVVAEVLRQLDTRTSQLAAEVASGVTRALLLDRNVSVCRHEAT